MPLIFQVVTLALVSRLNELQSFTGCLQYHSTVWMTESVQVLRANTLSCNLLREQDLIFPENSIGALQ